MSGEKSQENANRTRRTLLNILFILIAAPAAIYVLDLWFDILSGRILGKLFVTLIIGAGVLAVWLAIRAHIREEETMTKDKYLN